MGGRQPAEVKRLGNRLVVGWLDRLQMSVLVDGCLVGCCWWLVGWLVVGGCLVGPPSIQFLLLLTDDDNSATMTMTMMMAMMPNDYYDEQPPAKPLFLRLRGQSLVCCSNSYCLKVLYV